MPVNSLGRKLHSNCDRKEGWSTSQRRRTGKMAAPIHVAAVDTGSAGDGVRKFRIIPPPDTHLEWNDRELTCLAVNMARCAVGGAIRRLLGSTWRYRIENGGLTIETAGLKVYTTTAPNFGNERAWASMHIDQSFLEKHEAWLCEPL